MVRTTAVNAGDEGRVVTLRRESWVIPASDSEVADPNYGDAMDLRALALRHRDPLLAGVLATGYTVEILAWVDDGLVAALAAGLLASLPLVLRRRSALTAFVLSMVGTEVVTNLQPGFDNDSVFLVATYLIAVYSLGRYARGAEAWLGAAALVVAMTLFVQQDVAPQGPDAGDIAFVLAFVGSPWAAGLAVRLRRERERELTLENESIRLEQEAVARRAVTEERSRIARELHDVVAHAISVTVVQSRGARRILDTDPDGARQALDAIEHTNTQALGDMRRLLAVLRDTEDDAGTTPQPSLARLDDLLADVRQSGLDVRLETSGNDRDVPPGVDLSAYRIVQEALTNVLKHGAGATALVRIDYRPDELSVAVTDDGQGAAAVASAMTGGHGLIGIRERVAVVGGDIEAGRAPEGGFRVRARLPYSVDR